jgi:hypothetical protein
MGSSKQDMEGDAPLPAADGGLRESSWQLRLPGSSELGRLGQTWRALSLLDQHVALLEDAGRRYLRLIEVTEGEGVKPRREVVIVGHFEGQGADLGRCVRRDRYLGTGHVERHSSFVEGLLHRD